MKQKFWILLLTLCMVGISNAQLIKFVSGTIINPDNSVPTENEVIFQGYLTSEPSDSSAIDSCSSAGGWAIVLNEFNETGKQWTAGDTLVMLFKNITGKFSGLTSSVEYITNDENVQNIGNITLPVELTTFEAIVENGIVTDKVILRWRTVGETNNVGFEVHKSTDGKNFDKIGFLNGAGSTNIAQSYEFADTDVDVGVYYYRLKQIDTDGSFTFTEIKEINVTPPKIYYLSQNYPNPFNPETNIVFKLKEDVRVTIKVFNILGREVMTLVDDKMKAGTHNIRLDGRELPSGVYLYSMKAGNFSKIKKMTLLK